MTRVYTVNLPLADVAAKMFAGSGQEEKDWRAEIVDDLKSAAWDSLQAWEIGACNVPGVARSFRDYFLTGVEWNRSVHAPRIADQADAAKAANAWWFAPARLIFAQLASLMGQGIGDYALLENDRNVCRLLAAGQAPWQEAA